MGGVKVFLSEGGFREYTYHQVGEVVSVNGVTAKIIAKDGVNGGDDYHAGLPSRSDTSSAYVKLSDEGSHPPEQLKIFENRVQSIDFDWGHSHGDKFPKGVVHVQDYDKNGNRTGKTRFMNNAEMKKYSPILRFLSPDVRFRP